MLISADFLLFLVLECGPDLHCKLHFFHFCFCVGTMFLIEVLGLDTHSIFKIFRNKINNVAFSNVRRAFFGLFTSFFQGRRSLAPKSSQEDLPVCECAVNYLFSFAPFSKGPVSIFSNMFFQKYLEGFTFDMFQPFQKLRPTSPSQVWHGGGSENVLCKHIFLRESKSL